MNGEHRRDEALDRAGSGGGWRYKIRADHFGVPNSFSKDDIYRRCVPEPNTGCWLWIGNYEAHGYGAIEMKGKRYLAHRYAYLVFKGEIPEGLELDHLCRTPACVNPDHLEAVDHRTNILRGVSPMAFKAKSDTCPRGHLKPAPKVEVKGKPPIRRCVPCRRAARRARYAIVGRWVKK